MEDFSYDVCYKRIFSIALGNKHKHTIIGQYATLMSWSFLDLHTAFLLFMAERP